MATTPINGNTLRWARELSHVSIEELAAAVGTKPARIADFEQGASKPTFRQLTLIADKLDRPLAFFFPEAPSTPDIPSTADFRGRADGELPGALAREMKRAEQQRNVMLDFEASGASRIDLRPVSWEDAAEHAALLRDQLGLTNSFTPPESQHGQVFNFWRGLLEEQGFLVFQTTRIPLAAFRGLSIHHEQLPIILINGADSASGKAFTLFHEVAHLANRTSGICLLTQNVNEEATANRFAASFLMPETEIRRVLRDLQHNADPVEALASRFKVSPLAAGVRLRTLGVISDSELAEIRRISDEKWERIREEQKNTPGFVPQWRLRYRDLGSSYIGTVAHALENGRIDILDASYLLNARVPMVEQLIHEFHRVGGSE